MSGRRSWESAGHPGSSRTNYSLQPSPPAPPPRRAGPTAGSGKEVIPGTCHGSAPVPVTNGGPNGGNKAAILLHGEPRYFRPRLNSSRNQSSSEIEQRTWYSVTRVGGLVSQGDCFGLRRRGFSNPSRQSSQRRLYSFGRDPRGRRPRFGSAQMHKTVRIHYCRQKQMV